MELSYWELQYFFNSSDLVVIGSGIVGLNAAISYKSKHPKHKVIVLERGLLPMGASTKNAGFACFGSVTELISDLTKMEEHVVWETVALRYKGLKRLRKLIGDKHLDYKNLGGFEVFSGKKEYEERMEVLPYFNKKVREITSNKSTYRANPKKSKESGLTGWNHCIENCEEGQINSGLMMGNLLELARRKGIIILNGISVSQLKDNKNNCSMLLNNSFELNTRRVIVATNGFASQLLKLKSVKPARAQVLITNKIKGLKLKGAFHYEEGFYYFRNIDGRVLFGGGRNLDFKGEETFENGLTKKIQHKLEKLLKENILAYTSYTIEHRWSGIMGVGSEKKPIVKQVSDNIVCAVRMGGMGVAIGSLIGEMAADLIDQ